MLSSYLSLKSRIVFLFLILICGLFGSTLQLLVVTFLFIGAYFLFRKRDIFKAGKQQSDNSCFYAPVNGKIVDVISESDSKPNFTLVRVAIMWWKEMGLFLPVDSEVVGLINRPGIPFYRFGDSALLHGSDRVFSSFTLELESTAGDRYEMKLVRCPTGSAANTYLEIGDIAKQLVNIGDFLLGGTVLLYLPKKYEILVKKGDSIIAGQTVLANI